ncbi:MAG: hypothetical protein D6761_08790 [Candidatus Dadabacteria bacterium]|nr:MAG: hypothetical protein D6761_08790 [Candidatus Dadabacteria bacterium]
MLIDDLIRRNSRIQPQRPAVRSSDLNLSWRETERRAAALASQLAAAGVGHGDRVVVMHGNSPWTLLSWYAIWSAGAVLVPISPLASQTEVADAIRRTSARLVIADRSSLPLCHEVSASLKSPVWTSAPDGGAADGRLSELSAPTNLDSPPVRSDDIRTERDPAVIAFTSGTSGRPKGAMLSHRNMLASATSVALERSLTWRDRYYFATPMNHISAISFGVMTALSGGSFQFAGKFDAERFVDDVRREPVTFVFLVPAMLRMVLDVLDRRGEKHLNAKALRLVCYGAAPIAPALLAEAIERLGCGFSQAYGMTEAAPVVSVLPPEDHTAAVAGEHAERLRSAGRPTFHARIRILDPDTRTPLPPGEVGEIAVAGPSLFQGYLDDPEASSSAFLGEWFLTGDGGHLDEHGYLYVSGRRSDLILSGGVNVYPREIELVLQEHPAVLEAVVIGVPDDKWGERVVACVRLAEAEVDTSEMLFDFCRERLARYKVPKEIIPVEAFPRNPTGKILRRALLQRLDELKLPGKQSREDE